MNVILLTAVRGRAGKTLAVASQRARQSSLESAAYGWDASPITTARLSAELWAHIQKEDWSLVSYLNPVSNWPMRLWNFAASNAMADKGAAASVQLASGA